MKVESLDQQESKDNLESNNTKTTTKQSNYQNQRSGSRKIVNDNKIMPEETVKISPQTLESNRNPANNTVQLIDSKDALNKSSLGVSTPIDNVNNSSMVLQKASGISYASVIRKYKETKQNIILYDIGVFFSFFTIVMISEFQQYYWIYHLILTFILLVQRFISFRRRKLQYYMLDFCYLMNYALFIYCIFMILSYNNVLSTELDYVWDEWFRTIFSWTTGPILQAVIMFQNALVFHECDKMVSLFIHVSPSLCVWSMRWFPHKHEQTFPGMFNICRGETVDNCETDFMHSYIIPLILFIGMWSIPYYLIRFIILGKHIKEGCYDTLDNHVRKMFKFLDKFLKKQSDPVAGIFYLSCVTISMLFQSALSMVWWMNYWAHTIFLIVCTMFSVHYAASFYMVAIPSRHVKHEVFKLSQQTNDEKNL